MSQTTTVPVKRPKLKKGIRNFLLFLIIILVAVIIITYKQKFNWLKFSGTTLTVTSCFLVFYYFLYQFRSEVLDVTRKIVFLLVTIIIFLAATKLVTGIQGKDFVLLVPFAIIPVIIRTFYDARLGLFTLLIAITLGGFMVPEPFVFIYISFISGMVAIFTLKNIYKRVRFVFTSLAVIIASSASWLSITLMQNGNLQGDIWSHFLIFTGNGLLVMLSYPLISVFEQRLLFLSDATLLELTDTNHPLLRKLAEEAPGSYQHSLQVANLAEEAARVAGANPLLVKAGALYHDIGKLANPKYFVENQGDGESLHYNLTPKESAKVILNHVRNGVNLAKNYKIPGQIIDFIRSHHGTTVAYFFYKKFLDQNPGMLNVEKDFAYPGPKPFSKETAVVMMADAVEAATRSLDKFTEESISELVERIIYLQEQDGQYSEVPLTYRDISDIKSVFRKRLSGIHHVRIAYPERP